MAILRDTFEKKNLSINNLSVIVDRRRTLGFLEEPVQMTGRKVSKFQ